MVVHRDERRGRASSFGEVADAYERARPGYPDDAVRWLTGDRPCDVVDLGAGTGKLTRSLVALGHRVVAVEPLPEMRRHLRAAVPQARVLAGSAEAVPVAAESADVVTCAQAFHWFEHDVALPEIARVLRPGGRVALVWNTRDDRVPWVAELSDTVCGRETVTQRDAVGPLEASGLFGPVEQASFPLVQRLDRQTLLDLVLSRSYCAVRSEAERAPLLEQAGRIFDANARGGVVELAYVAECFRAVKR
jgi:SAM-dependent methyltransferase